MADSALFIGWGPVVRGREQQALELFNESMQYYGELQQKKEIENFEVALLEAHGGDLSGFILLRGDVEKLSRLRHTRNSSASQFERSSTSTRWASWALSLVAA